METSSSRFTLDTKYNSKFISPYQKFNSNIFITTSDYFGFRYDTCNINGNFTITGNILSIDFRSFIIYTTKDFNLNDLILAEDNIIINANNSNITCDNFRSYSTENYVYSNQYILSNVYLYYETSKITKQNIDQYRLFCNAYVNILTQNNLQINSHSTKIQGNSIFFWPLNRFKLTGNNIFIKQKNDQVITRTSISTNTLRFISNIDMHFKSNTISYITDLFSANLKNVHINGNTISIQTNEKKILALSAANILINTESAIFQGYDQNFKSNFISMKSNLCELNNNLYDLNSNNITFINTTNKITANVIYLSCKTNTANLHNFKLFSGQNNLSSRHLQIMNQNEMKLALKNKQILANIIQNDAKIFALKSNICHFNFERNNIDGNNVALQSNTFVINNMQTQINSKISNFSSNFKSCNAPVLTWVNKQEWISTVHLLSNVLTSEMKMTVNSRSMHRVEKLNIHSYRKILNFIHITANISDHLVINGNVNMSANIMNWQSNVFSLSTKNSIIIYSNQLVGTISNGFRLRSNAAVSIQTPILNIQSNLHFTQTDCTLIANAITIKGNDFNVSSGNLICDTKSIIINNHQKAEISSKNIFFSGNVFLIHNKTNASFDQLNDLTGTFKSVNLHATHFEDIDCNELKLHANFITINANNLKLNAPATIRSNTFVMRGNYSSNLFKMIAVDSIHINSNNNLSNYGVFRSTFDRGNIFVSNMTARHTNTTFLSNSLFIDNSKTIELNANINGFQLQDFSFHGNNVYIRSKAVSMSQNNLNASSNVLRLGGNLTLLSNLGNFNISNCNFTVDQLGLSTPNLIIHSNKTFVIKGNNLNVQSNNLVNANGIIEIKLNLNHAIIKSNVDVGVNDLVLKSNTIELSQTSSFALNNPPGKSNIQMDHTSANIGLNQFNLQFQNTNLFNSENMRMAHSNTISIECFGFHGLNADRVANITGNIFQVVQNESQITASQLHILFEKANIVSNAHFFIDYANQVSITSQGWNFLSKNHTLINSTQFDLNQNMVILTTSSFLKIDGSIQVASLSNQTNMTASNSFTMRSNALISNTHIFNINSNHQFAIESTHLAATFLNSNMQSSNSGILNANGLFITSNNISASSNDRIQINTSKLIQNSNKVDISLGNGNLRSNQLLITGNNLNYTGIDLNINANSTNINCRRQADVDFTNNTFITANNLLMNSVLSVFDVFTFDLKNDTSVRKRLFIPKLNPLGNTLQFLNSEKLNLLNGYYMVKGNIGFNPSSNVMINIGTDNCVLNLKGSLNYINTNEFEFNSRNIFFNSNAVGSGTAQGAGIYIRDNNDDGKSFILVSDNGLGYTFKPPETENTFKLQFDSFYANGFLKCVQNGTSQIYNLQPETLQIGTVGLLTAALDTKLNLSGGTMTGNLIMGANKITSSNTNSDPRDISNLAYVSTKLPLSGGTMTGSIEMNSFKISSMFEPVSNSDLVNKHYLDSTKLALSGGTLSGNLDLEEFRMSSNFVASANSDLTNRKFLYDTFLPWVGGTMNGNVNSSFKITSNYVASAKPDITNKLYVDSTRVSTIADVVMLGNIIMSGNTKLTSNFYAAANADLTHKQYTDENLVKLIGGILTGNLHLDQNFKISSNHVPIFNTDITNKKYVIEKVFDLRGGSMVGNVVMSSNFKLASNYLAFAHSDLTNKEFMDKNFVLLKSNNILKGNLHLESNKLTSNFRATDKWDIVNKKYTDESLFSIKGGILNGNIIMSSNFKLASNFTPIANSDFTNKQYLDMNFVSLRGNTLTGNLNMSGLFKISSNYTASSNSDITNKLFLDSNVLKLKGGSMVGHMNMVDKKITTTATPTQNFDLTNKLYADSKLNISGTDVLTGNLTLNSNLVLTQQSRIIHKNGTLPFRGNVLIRSFDAAVGGNMICHNLPQVQFIPAFHLINGNELIPKSYMDTKVASRDGRSTGDTRINGNIYTEVIAPLPSILYAFTSHTFTTTGKTGLSGPTLAEVRNAYSGVSWAQNSEFLNMTRQGIQEWRVPATGIYRIRAVGAGVPYDERFTVNGMNQFQNGMDATITTTLTKGEVIQILVGQQSINKNPHQHGMGGAGGTFVVRGTQTPIIVAGGGGGRGATSAQQNSNATINNTGQTGLSHYGNGDGGVNGGGGGSAGGNGSGGGGLIGDGITINAGQQGGKSFINGGMGGSGNISDGGFGGGGGNATSGGSGGGGYSGGGGAGLRPVLLDIWLSGGGGGSYSITGQFDSAVANNRNNGVVVISAVSIPIPVSILSNVSMLPNRTINANTITNGILQIGMQNKFVKLLGATTKGSLLVGNNTNTEELVLGGNDTILQIVNQSAYWEKIKIISNTFALLPDYVVLLSSSNGSFFKSNLIFNSGLNRLETKNVLINKTIQLPRPLKSNAPNELMIQSFFLETIQRTKFQVSKTSTVIDAYYPVLYENNNSPLRIQLNLPDSFASPTTNTSTILKMDSIQMGGEQTISVSDSSIFQVGNNVQIRYNSNNIVRGIVSRIILELKSIVLKITFILRDIQSAELINTTDLNKQRVIINNFSPRSFLRLRTLQSAISRSNITYSICDSNGAPFSSVSPPAFASFLTINNSRIQILADQNNANARSTFLYTIRASINISNFVFINVKLEYISLTNSFTCTFTNNTSVFSNSITWNLPSAGVVFSDIQQYNYIFLLPSPVVLQRVGVMLTGLRDNGSATRFEYLIKIFNNQSFEASSGGQSSSADISTIHESTISANPTRSRGFVYGPNGNDLVIEIAPSSTQASGITGWQYQSGVSTQGGSNSFIGIITAYPIDYSVGEISILDNTNNLPNLTYFHNTRTLSTYGLSTTFLPRLTASTLPTGSNQLVSKRYADQHVQNVSAIRFIQDNRSNYSLLLRSTSLNRIFATNNTFYNSISNRLNCGSRITPLSRLASSVRLSLGLTIAQTNITPGLIPLNMNPTNLFGNDSAFRIQDTGNRSFLGLGSNAPSFPLHITLNPNPRGIRARFVDAPGGSFTLCCSANGTIVMRGLLGRAITVSRNSGQTSTSIDMGGGGEYYVSCSLNGQFMFANSWNGVIRTSINGGFNWLTGNSNGTWSMSGAYTRGPFFSPFFSNNTYYSFTVNYGGGNGLSQWGGYINAYRNGDFITRILIERGPYVFFYPGGSSIIASSNDLNVMYVVPGPFATPGLLIKILFDTWYGTFRTVNYIYLPQTTTIKGVDCSSDGRVVYVVTMSDIIYRSNDEGITWDQLARPPGPAYNYYGWDGTLRTMNLPGNAFPNIGIAPYIPYITSVSCNSTGQIVLIGLINPWVSSIVGGPGLFYSNNSGTDWININNSAERGYLYTAVPKYFNTIVGAYAIQNQSANLAITETATGGDAALRASGAVASSGQIISSDNRLKSNINPIADQIIRDIRFINTKTYKMITSDQKYIGLLAQNVEKIYANCVHNQTRIIPNIMIWVSIILTQDLHYKYPTKKIYKVCTLDPRQKIKFKAYHPKIELKNEQGQIITAYAIYKQSNKQFYIELGNTAINPGKYLLLGEEVDDSRSIDVSNVYTVREAYTKMMEQRQLQTKKQITRLTERLFTFQQLLEKQNEIIRLCAAKKNIEVN